MPKYQPGSKADRQYGVFLEEIRSDHLKRYQLAAQKINPRSRVIDVACGCGYGSWILHSNGLDVTGVDISEHAISYAEKNYSGPKYIQSRAQDLDCDFDVLVSFETLEHVPDPEAILKGVRAPLIIASVPNEEKNPFNKERFLKDEYPHLRHYTPKEFEDLLGLGGYQVEEWFCQKDKAGEIFTGNDGIFIIALASKG